MVGRMGTNWILREGLYACPGPRLGRKLNLCGGETARMTTTPAAPDMYKSDAGRVDGENLGFNCRSPRASIRVSTEGY